MITEKTKLPWRSVRGEGHQSPRSLNKPHPHTLFSVCCSSEPQSGTQQRLPLRSSISVWILIENWTGVDRRGELREKVGQEFACRRELLRLRRQHVANVMGDTGEETESWWSPIMLHAWGRTVRSFSSVDDPSLQCWKKKRPLFYRHDWNRCIFSRNAIASYITRQMTKIWLFLITPQAPFTVLISFKSICWPAGTCLHADKRYTACQAHLTAEVLRVSRRGRCQHVTLPSITHDNSN